jgi:hypothetical protein
MLGRYRVVSVAIGGPAGDPLSLGSLPRVPLALYRGGVRATADGGSAHQFGRRLDIFIGYRIDYVVTSRFRRRDHHQRPHEALYSTILASPARGSGTACSGFGVSGTGRGEIKPLESVHAARSSLLMLSMVGMPASIARAPHRRRAVRMLTCTYCCRTVAESRHRCVARSSCDTRDIIPFRFALDRGALNRSSVRHR